MQIKMFVKNLFVWILLYTTYDKMLSSFHQGVSVCDFVKSV